MVGSACLTQFTLQLLWIDEGNSNSLLRRLPPTHQLAFCMQTKVLGAAQAIEPSPTPRDVEHGNIDSMCSRCWPFPLHTGAYRLLSEQTRLADHAPFHQSLLHESHPEANIPFPGEFSQPGAEKKAQRQFVDNNRVAKRCSRHGGRRARNKSTGNCRFLWGYSCRCDWRC